MFKFFEVSGVVTVGLLSVLTGRRVARRVFTDHVQADTSMVMLSHGFGSTDVDVTVSHADGSACDVFKIGFWAPAAVLVRFPVEHAVEHAVEHDVLVSTR